MSKDDLHHASSGYSFPFLDGLRGLAILSVVICHVAITDESNPLEKMMGAAMSAGHLGVSIFFVLSGFLISLAVFSIKNKKDLYRYALRRVGKILPPFYLTIFLLGLMTFLWKRNSDVL